MSEASDLEYFSEGEDDYEYEYEYEEAEEDGYREQLENELADVCKELQRLVKDHNYDFKVTQKDVDTRIDIYKVGNDQDILAYARAMLLPDERFMILDYVENKSGEKGLGKM